MDAVNHLLDNLGASAIPITLLGGEGAVLWDDAGKRYWDFYGGHAVSLLGQGHPVWIEALAAQARSLTFFSTLASLPVRSEAAAALCALTEMDVAFFVNSGAEANEAALKIARKATGREVIVALEGGFHGRTMGAVGVTWHYREQHAPAHGVVRHVPVGDSAALDAALDESVAAVIAEPVQGIAGVVVPPEGWLAEVARKVRAVGGLFIADEIQSGMGRAGYPLSSRHQGISPDIATVGKGLGGGFPVAATLMTRALAETVKPGQHGTTFGGAPLAMAAVKATLEIVAREDLFARGRRLGQAMHAALAPIPGVRAVRGEGVLIGVVLDRPAKPVASALLERGVMVGTASDPAVLRLSPPMNTPFEAIESLANALKEIL